MRLTRRGEDIALALCAISCAGLAHLYWNLIFDNPIDFPALVGMCISSSLGLLVLLTPMYATEDK